MLAMNVTHTKLQITKCCTCKINIKLQQHRYDFILFTVFAKYSNNTAIFSFCRTGSHHQYCFQHTIDCIQLPNIGFFRLFQGQSVETERCGSGLGQSWECIYGGGSALAIGGEIAAVMPEVQEEVGLHCRCGCVVHLGQTKPKRLLAASSQSCPGRSFWLIQVGISLN